MLPIKEFDKTEKEMLFKDSKEKANPKNLGYVLQNVFERVSQFDMKIFYDFLGELLLEKTQVLGKKKRIIGSYLRIVKRFKLSPNQLLELEKYLVEKYFILDNEKLLLYFQGKFRDKNQRRAYKGRIFISDQRIMVIGKEEVDESLAMTISGGF